MVREDWVSVGIPRGVIDELDLFLKTEDAKKIGVMNRQQIITLLLRKFIDEGIELLSKSDNTNLIQNQLEDRIDEKFDELLKILPDIMLEFGSLKTQDQKTITLRKKNIMKKLLSSQSIPESVKKKLSNIKE